jgi:hypothetical protein
MDKWKWAPSAPYKTDPIKGQLKRGGCTKGTHEDILERICNWAMDDSSSPIFWLREMAGKGKSAIAFTICELFDKRNTNKPGGASLGASFFCSCQVENICRRGNIIPMLAYQLACHSRLFAEKLDKANHNAIDTSSGQVKELLAA